MRRVQAWLAWMLFLLKWDIMPVMLPWLLFNSPINLLILCCSARLPFMPELNILPVLRKKLLSIGYRSDVLFMLCTDRLLCMHNK